MSIITSPGYENPLLEGMNDAAAIKHRAAEHCDVVVVGSGAGGAVVAKELAEGGMQVILLEEGGYHTQHHDLAYEGLGRLYRDFGFTSTLGRPFIPIPLGKCFGGTTTVNSGTCFRTPEAVVERWRTERGLDAIDPQALDRIFDRVEEEIDYQPASFEVMSRSNTLVHELLAKEEKAGFPLRRNAKACQGCGMCCYGCTSGAKKSMEQNYLPKALKAGARAWVNARVTEILRDASGAVTGVRAEGSAESGRAGRLTVYAPKVILACGALLTPVLLKQNGIARGNRHLGRHLTIHPASKVAAEFEDPIDSWIGIPQAYGYDGLREEGIKFEGITMPPDLGPMAVPFIGKELAHYIKSYRHVATYGFMIHDTSEGALMRVPFAGYMFRYSLTKTDVARFHRAICFLARLFLKGGAKAVYAMALIENNRFTSLEEVDRFEARGLKAGEIEGMAFHPLGSCRMSDSPKTGVCDAWQQVYGTPGLYLCDGSVVPTALGVNPQETIMGLATRLAEHLLGVELPPHAS